MRDSGRKSLVLHTFSKPLICSLSLEIVYVHGRPQHGLYCTRWYIGRYKGRNSFPKSIQWRSSGNEGLLGKLCCWLIFVFVCLFFLMNKITVNASYSRQYIYIYKFQKNDTYVRISSYLLISSIHHLKDRASRSVRFFQD